MLIYEPSSTKIHTDWDKDYEQLHNIGENFFPWKESSREPGMSQKTIFLVFGFPDFEYETVKLDLLNRQHSAYIKI